LLGTTGRLDDERRRRQDRNVVEKTILELILALIFTFTRRFKFFFWEGESGRQE
jgi:hypothetical protein